MNKPVLTDSQINEIWDSCEDAPALSYRYIVTSAIEQAILSKLSEQEPVAFCRVEDAFDNDSILAQLGVKRGDNLYTTPQHCDRIHCRCGMSNELVEKDAERYRYLRTAAIADDEDFLQALEDADANPDTPERFDAAIDAAIEQYRGK
jgi:hypothetical protein